MSNKTVRFVVGASCLVAAVLVLVFAFYAGQDVRTLVDLLGQDGAVAGQNGEGLLLGISIAQSACVVIAAAALLLTIIKSSDEEFFSAAQFKRLVISAVFLCAYALLGLVRSVVFQGAQMDGLTSRPSVDYLVPLALSCAMIVAAFACKRAHALEQDLQDII